MGDCDWVNMSIHPELFRYFGNDFNGELVVMVHAVAIATAIDS
jgi:hypothetical protein